MEAGGLLIRSGDSHMIHVNAQGRELVSHGTAVFPLGCYEVRPYERPVPWHWHDDWELFIARKGVVLLSTPAGEQRLAPGQAVFLGTGCVHEVMGDGPGCTLHSAVFHPRFLASQDGLIWQKYIQPLQGVGAVPLLPGEPWQEEAIALFEKCLSAFDQARPGYEIDAREALTRLAFLLYTRLDTCQRLPSAKEARHNQRIRTMLQFIQEHYAEDLSVAKIAASAMLSESECLRCFRSTINTTPGQYLKDHRLQKAAQLLASTEEKVGDIGAACGLPDAAYFTKLFREAMGRTPVEYRRAARQAGRGGP